MIEAELTDGRVLEFPDGTDPQVIQSTVKRVLAENPVQDQQAQPQATTQAEQDSGRGPLADIALEGMAAFNRGATRMADFLTTDQINAVSEILGSEFRAPSVTEATSAGTQGNFMEEGLGRDVVRGAGELVAPGVAGGQLARGAARQLPRFGAQSEGVASGAIRQAGRTTGTLEARVAAGSGAGAELGGAAGQEMAGDQGEQIGRLLGGLGGAVTAGARPQRSRTDQPTPQRQATETQMQAREAAEATGVDLMPAQQSLDPQQLRAQRFLPELTPATERAAQALSRQNQQASSAVDDFVRSIAPDDAITTGATRFRSASQRALEASRQIRAEKASPLYKEAFDSGANVEITPVRNAIERTLSEFPESGGVAKGAQRIARMVGESPSLKQLHNAKLEIDDMLTKVGDGSLGNTAKRELRGIKQTLVNQMEEASPEYRQARLTFEAESPRVTELEESIIGKIADIDDTQLKNVSRRIFDPAETNPTVVRQAKKVIDEVDPDAWNRLMRAEVERRIGSVKPEVGTSFENLPGKLNRAIFGSGKQREALLSGMSDDQRRNAELVERALTRASLGRPGGSETAGRQQFIKELDSGVVSSIRNFLREPIDKAIGVGESAAFDRRARALADTLFDPAWSGEARKAIKDGSESAFGYLLYRAVDTIEREETRRAQEGQEAQQAPDQPEDRSQTELPAQ